MALQCQLFFLFFHVRPWLGAVELKTEEAVKEAERLVNEAGEGGVVGGSDSGAGGEEEAWKGGKKVGTRGKGKSGGGKGAKAKVKIGVEGEGEGEEKGTGEGGAAKRGKRKAGIEVLN